LMESFNVNFLAIFMVANLLVGVVNMTVYTLDTPTDVSIAIVTAYTALVCAVAYTWRLYGVTLKFW
jgi:phosphatidylinositol glycan class W